ncbi:MAG: hypothetical protein PHP46_01590 [Candidatus Omnitrophica bacterium]|nr:hypothetical protein [Candidatus Omnitrophota bacterium]
MPKRLLLPSLFLSAMTDELLYIRKQEEAELTHEALCHRCGFCCGAKNDPCLNLAEDASGRYYCKVYDNRIGSQKTVSGKSFSCVPIRDVLTYFTPNPDCGYVKKR